MFDVRYSKWEMVVVELSGMMGVIMRFFSSSLKATVLPLLLAGVIGCGSGDKGEENVGADGGAESGVTLPAGFGDYWYAGLAELNRYRLEQARYGEIREGDAVLVFVTEDFLVDEQVKLESDPGDREATGVLKVNMTKNFLTGVYPYSMMTSVFTPIESNRHPHTLKVTTTSQEWCGHTFTQINRLADAWRVREFSYFEKEGDSDREVEAAMVEDELWTRIRLNPETLPIGDVTMIPGTMTARLLHTDHSARAAMTRRVDLPQDSTWGGISRYMVEYTDPPRTLMIDYTTTFPHHILGWSETYNDRGTVLTTRATLTDTLRLDYWSRNALADSTFRQEFGY